MFETIEKHWSGPKWRIWAFVAGTLSVGLAIVVAFVASAITGERFIPLILLLLVSVILAASVVGSGIIESLSSQMNRGGLARETTDDIDRTLENDPDIKGDRENENVDDRRTIRCGLFIIGPIAAFVYLMTIV